MLIFIFMNRIKLSEYAKRNNITYKTAYMWYKENKITENVTVSKSGSIFVDVDSEIDIKGLPVYTYARVSSHEKIGDLNRQQSRCIKYCELNGYGITKNFKEVGSGMNDSRKQLVKLMEQPIGIIVVENKDRLTRFGFNYLNTLYSRLGGKIIVINQNDNGEEDLMKDLISIITSFCCRLYGLRRGYNKAKNIKDNIESL